RPAVNAPVRNEPCAGFRCSCTQTPKANWYQGPMVRQAAAGTLCCRRIATKQLTMPEANEKLRRRSRSRKPFTASTLVFEPKSETHLRARTGDLGLDGCFVDTLNPFAPGTMLKMR